MNYYFEDCCRGENTDLGSPIPYHIFEYLRLSTEPTKGLDTFTENIASIPSERTLDEHESDNQNSRLSVSPSAFEGSSLGYNLFDSKQTITKQLIHHMSSIGKDRDRTKKENLYLIESDILKCRNQLLELEGFYLGQCRSADQKRLSIEQRLFDLYREKRVEESSCWRDKLWLERDLVNLLREYLEIERRKNLINEIMEGDYTTNQNHD